jgi:hypothetical protein
MTRDPEDTPSTTSDDDVLEAVTREFEGERERGIEATLESLGTGTWKEAQRAEHSTDTSFLTPPAASTVHCRPPYLHAFTPSCPSFLPLSGAYQWRLFALCGCGWMSDNSALACIAVILPRVQVHFGLEDHVVGLLSASTMGGVSVPPRQCAVFGSS